MPLRPRLGDPFLFPAVSGCLLWFVIAAGSWIKKMSTTLVFANHHHLRDFFLAHFPAGPVPLFMKGERRLSPLFGHCDGLWSLILLTHPSYRNRSSFKSLLPNPFQLFHPDSRYSTAIIGLYSGALPFHILFLCFLNPRFLRIFD